MRKHKRLAFEVLEPRQLLAADVIVTEFMASNGGWLEDGNGASSDWIEIYNAGDQSVDLLGYGLTDDPSDANQWQFSANQVLDPGDFLIVFASGNDQPDAAGNLHTNFSLSASGEYLALINPSGTVLSEFNSGGANYPAQISDVSYGLAFNALRPAVVTPESSAHYRIPPDASEDATWTDHNFDDSVWQTGTASVGYENVPADFDDLIETTIPNATTSVYVRIPFTITDPNALLDTLQMKYDDGFIAYINGTRVASANAPDSGANYLSVATTDHPDGLAVDFIDFDVSAYPHILNVGANTLAIHLLNINSASTDLLMVPNLIVVESAELIEPTTIGTLETPTPRLPNTNLRATEVLFSRVGGVFTQPFQLTMTSSGQGESIRYTTDGSTPQASSSLYTAPITVNSTTVFRARAFGPVGQLGDVTTESYTETDSTTGNFTSDLPIVVLENFGQGTPQLGDFEDATLALYEVDETTGRSALSNPADLTSIIGQHRRGSSTASNPKPNLRIEIRDNNGEDQSVSLLGMPAESDWILYAPYQFDRAMLRNTAFFEFSRQMGRYAARTRFIEVYGNFDNGELNSNDYLGVYVLMENIKRDSNRVDIDKLTPDQNTVPDVAGGYIIKLDRRELGASPDSFWKTDRNIPTLETSELVHVEPERSIMTASQVDYIRDYIQDFEDSLFGPNSTDPLLGYQAYFDVDASIDSHLIQAWSKEPDGLRLSTYLTKDRDGKLAFGPIWDFDRSAGADNDSRAANPTGWDLPDVNFFESDWWGPLFDDPNFLQRWVDRWQELRTTVLSDANIEATIVAQASEIAEAQARNFAEWPQVAPNGGPYAAPGFTGWEGEVSHLINWLITRANWMDDQMFAPPTFTPSPGNVSSGSQITLTTGSSGADIYYTLDGSDPRADGGGVSPSAMVYSGPLTANQTMNVNARTFTTSATAWSSLTFGLFSLEVPADASSLRITELNFHPADPTAAELLEVPGTDEDDFEFIELFNVSDDTISLNSVQLSEAVTFDFSSGQITSLAPGAAVIVVNNTAAFTARYGTGLPVTGEYSGKFGDGGEQVVLTDGAGQVIHDFTYDDIAPWPVAADGGGPSLEIVDPLDDHSVATNWRASNSTGGSPGTVVSTPPGDFDQDNDVDGFDFLAWQMGFASEYDTQDLTDWEIHYGTSASPLVAANLSADGDAMEEENTAPLATASAISPGALVDAAIVLWGIDQEENIDDDTLLQNDDLIMPEALVFDHNDRVATDPARKIQTDLADDLDDANETEGRTDGQSLDGPLPDFFAKPSDTVGTE